MTMDSHGLLVEKCLRDALVCNLAEFTVISPYWLLTGIDGFLFCHYGDLIRERILIKTYTGAFHHLLLKKKKRAWMAWRCHPFLSLPSSPPLNPFT